MTALRSKDVGDDDEEEKGRKAFAATHAILQSYTHAATLIASPSGFLYAVRVSSGSDRGWERGGRWESVRESCKPSCICPFIAKGVKITAYPKSIHRNLSHGRLVIILSSP